MNDRLNASRAVKAKILPAIDKNDFLGLSNENCERVELFLFAMALGIEKGLAPDKVPSISLVRAESIKPDWQNLMYTALMASFDDIETEIAQISDDVNVASYANRFADAGFTEIFRLMEDDSDMVLEELTADIASKYKKFVNDFPELNLQPIK